MVKRKNAWIRRILGVVLAVAMIMQPMSTSLSAIGVVQAAESENLLVNGDFASGSTGWSSYSGNTTITWNEGNVVFDITANDMDWAQGIYQKVKLEAGTYRVSLDIVSTVARTIKVDINDSEPREYTSDTIPANTKTTISYETSDVIAGGDNTFFIYLGTGYDSGIGAHQVTISNVSVVKVTEGGDAGNDENEGNTGSEGSGETTVTEVPATPFGVGGTYWENEDANKGRIFVSWGNDSTTTATSWTISIDGKELETVTSFGGYFYDNVYGAGPHTVSITANNAAGSSVAGTGTFTLTEEQAGKKAETDNGDENDNLTELIENGDFSDVSADGLSATNWGANLASPTSLMYEDGKAIFNVQSLGNDDWSNYLKYNPGINEENGKEYQISFTVKSSVDRTIQYGFDSHRSGTMTMDLIAGEETDISYTYTGTSDTPNHLYMFYLGKIAVDNAINPTDAHTVEISNVSIKTVSDDETEGDTPAVKVPNEPIGLNVSYIATEDVINVVWGAAYGDGGIPTEWIIAIDGKTVDTVNAVAAYTYENVYTAGEHTVTVVAKNSAGSSPAAKGTFTLTEEEAGVKDSDSDDKDSVEEVKGNLLVNGNFANKGENWSYWDNLATITWNEGSVVFDIKGNVSDYAQSIYQAVNLEAGVEYQVSFDIESSVERTVTAGFDPNREFTSDKIPANQKTTITYKTTQAATGSNSFMIFLGSDVGAHTVTISNVSIMKTTDAGDGDTTDTPAGADTEDGEPVPAVEGNLLKNGNFENKEENWGKETANADVYFNKYRTVFQIKGEAADWGQGLYQFVNLESGPTYKVSFDIETSVARTVTVDINDAGREFTSEVIPANEKTTISYETSDVNNGDNKFFIYLGAVTGLGNHKVVISNVSIVEMPVELPNDENDEAPAPLTSLKGINVDDAIALKDGKFTAGLSNWDTWCENWMEQYNVVRYTPVEDGMSVYITNVGDGEGNKAWDVQLNQNIDLKKDLEYTISFDIHSEKARAINLVINGLATGDFSKTIGLQKDETRHVVFNVPVQSEDALDKLFSIQMGKVTGEVRENTMTFTNMKIEVNGCEALAERVTDGKFTDGFGTFVANTTGNATVSVEEKSVLANILSNTQAEDVTLTRGGVNLESGVAYSLSFMAGATSGNRDISVQLPDGTSKSFTLTDEATLYTVDFAVSNNITEGEIKFLLGGAEDTICIDTVYLNAKGYAEATGINLAQHDIQALTKFVPPVLSEDVNAVEGEDVVLTYADADGAYTNAITAIKVNGTVIDKSLYAINQGTITLDSSLFTVSGERQAYTIEVDAYWYEKNEAIQIVYKTNQWKLTWSDEFNDSTLDMTKWSYQEGTGAEYGIEGWGNNEQQYYTRDNLSLGDGTMTITATSEDRGGKPYSSARIWSMGEDQQTVKFAQTYGRFEAKIKMPAGEGAQGLWPAFWLLPADSPYGTWPVSGEIDIMEARGREGDRTDSTLHYGKTYPNEAAEGKTYVWEDDALAITEYHIYSVDWTPTYMSFQVDGEEFYRATNWYCQGEGEPQKYAFPAPFDQDFYIIFNLAVGGMYDGNRNPSESALPAEMKVDYVRVYESTTPIDDSYIAPEPETETDEIPAGAKTSLIDPDFTDVKTVVNDTDEKNVNGWNLLTLSSYGGTANFSTVDIDGDTFAKVNITNVGSANYSVQLTQKLSLYKGHWYTLSFDAKADTAREIIAKLGGDGTNSWSTYHASTTKLTKDVQHYEYTFQMLNDSDPSSRLEMNMGLGTATSVYIGNIEFKEVEGYVINADVQKSPLEDGNHIYNGNFMTGDSSRLAYWHVSDSVSGVVKSGSEYLFRSKNATTLYQTGIEMLQSDTYKLTVDAKADSEQMIEIIFSDAKGNAYATKTVTVGTTKENKEVTFTMPVGVTDKNAVVTFKMDEGVELDNIVMIRETFNNVDYSGLNCYPLANGDFELGSLGWSGYQTTLDIANENGTNTAKVAGKAGGNRWDAMLIYGDLSLVGGYLYEFSFDAKADKDTAFDVVLEDGSYTRHLNKTDLAVGTEWQTYSYTFKLSTDVNVALKYLLGGANEAYNIDIDNVVLQMKGAPQESGSFIPDAYNQLGEDLVITHSGTEEWAKKAVIMLDGQELVKGTDYTFEGSTLKLNNALITESREYTISATAEGYADSTPVKFKMYPENGSRICNGDISFDDTAWKQYIHNGKCATLEYGDGHLDVHYEYAEADQYGIIPWAIQWNQDVTIDEAGNYNISFVAYSEVERYIMVSIANQSVKVKLTKEPKIHNVVVNIPSAGSYEVQFQMGATNPDTDNGYWTVDGFVDFGAHDIYVDSISMLPTKADVDGGTDTNDENVADTDIGIKNPIIYEEVSEGAPAIEVEIEKDYVSELVDKVLKDSNETQSSGKLYVVKASNKIIDIDAELDEENAEMADIAETVEIVEQMAPQNNLNIGVYLDIDLALYANDVKVNDIHELDEKIIITIDIPTELQKERREFKVIRVHGDDKETDMLDDLNLDSNPNTIEIETDRFSTYVLAYKDTIIPSDGSSNNNGSTNTNNTTFISFVNPILNNGENIESPVVVTEPVEDYFDVINELVNADTSVEIPDSDSTVESVEDQAVEEESENINEEVSSQSINEETVSVEKSSNTWLIIVLAVLAVVAVAVVVTVKIKSREDEN